MASGIDLTKIGTKNIPGVKQEQKPSIWQREISFKPKKLADSKKEDLYLQLYNLTSVGIDINTSLEIIGDEAKSNKKNHFISDIKNLLTQGSSLSEAIKSTGYFSSYESSTIKIGEETGQLSYTFKELHHYFSEKNKQRRILVGALTYPVIIIFSSLLTLFFMLYFIVPMFQDMYRRVNGELPWLTQKIILISTMLNQYWYLLLLLIAGIIISVILLSKAEKATVFFSKIFLKVPYFGRLLYVSNAHRFCHTMSFLISSRIPLLTALSICKDVIKFAPIKSTFSGMEKKLIAGTSFFECLKTYPIYEDKIITFVKIGESSNKLDHFLRSLSEQYQQEAKYKTEQMQTILEPILIIFVGIIVAVILIAMYLPIFQLSTSSF